MSLEWEFLALFSASNLIKSNHRAPPSTFFFLNAISASVSRLLRRRVIFIRLISLFLLMNFPISFLHYLSPQSLFWCRFATVLNNFHTIKWTNSTYSYNLCIFPPCTRLSSFTWRKNLFIESSALFPHEWGTHTRCEVKIFTLSELFTLRKKTPKYSPSQNHFPFDLNAIQIRTGDWGLSNAQSLRLGGSSAFLYRKKLTHCVRFDSLTFTNAIPLYFRSRNYTSKKNRGGKTFKKMNPLSRFVVHSLVFYERIDPFSFLWKTSCGAFWAYNFLHILARSTHVSEVKKLDQIYHQSARDFFKQRDGLRTVKTQKTESNDDNSTPKSEVKFIMIRSHSYRATTELKKKYEDRIASDKLDNSSLGSPTLFLHLLLTCSSSIISPCRINGWCVIAWGKDKHTKTTENMMPKMVSKHHSLIINYAFSELLTRDRAPTLLEKLSEMIEKSWFSWGDVYAPKFHARAAIQRGWAYICR